MPNGWRTIKSLVHKSRFHGRRGKGMAESFSREKLRHASQKEGGWEILYDLPPVWPRLKARIAERRWMRNLARLCWVEYYSWRTRVFYSSMYSTQHTHSLSTAFHTLLNILIAWVPLSILDSKYSKLEYRFPYSTRVWVRYRANTQRWVEYRVWLSILDSKYSKLEYNFPYSTQNSQSLSTT